MTALCFIDTETTGVHPGRQVWEVAMIRRDDISGVGGETEVSFFVNVDLSKADPFGLSVGRFYDRHPLGRYLSGWDPDAAGNAAESELSRSAAAEEVARWTYGAHLVGAVPNFDAETLDPLLRAHGLIPAWHYHLIDVENLAVGYLNGIRAAGLLGQPIPRDRPVNESVGEYLKDRVWRTGALENVTPPWKSDELSRAVGVEPPSDEERHTALGDARWAMRLYDAITNGP